MLNVWNELTRLALIGTDRIRLSDLLLEKLEKLGIDTTQDSAKIVLEAACFYSLMQRSGKSLKTWDGDIPFPCGSDESTPCSAHSVRHLSSILDGAYETALPEFIDQVSKNKKCLPPELLPDILDRCAHSTELWKQIKPTIGIRGFWLIDQNPRWEHLSHIPDSRHWETGKPEQRLALLEHMRNKDPIASIQLIKSTWQEENLQLKVKFLKILEHCLSLNDQAFLEECLDDRRKEIRQIAAGLLASIPDSKLVERIWVKLQDFISVQKKVLSKEKLEITLPEQITDSMIRDGIDPGAQWYKGGVKASRLGQMIAIIPPKKWERFFNRPPESVLQVFVSSNWAELLLQALVDATCRHKDMDWLETLINFWRDNREKQRWISFDPRKLLNVISPETFNKLAILSLEKKDNLMDEHAPVTALLRAGLFPWKDKLTRLVITSIQDWVAEESTRYWSGWHLRSILKQAAYYCNPGLFQELHQRWTSNSDLWRGWEREIDQFLSVLKFRKEMTEELESN